MTLFMLATLPALADEPVVPMDSGQSVQSISWARPFELATPQAHTMQADNPLYTRGWLVEVRADPALLVPSQIADPVLYLDEVPMMRFNYDWEGGCVVALVPGAPDLSRARMYFGSPQLPERVDAARGAQELAAAVALGVAPLDATQVDAAMAAGGDLLKADDLRQVHALAMERVSACTSTPADRQRAGVETPNTGL